MEIISEMETEQLLKDIMGNYPEYSSSSMRCVKWKYDEFKFTFIEDKEETNQEIKHEVTMKMAKEGFEKMMRDVLVGKGIAWSNFDGPLFDACSWDSTCTDALVQYAIFGKVIYG